MAYYDYSRNYEGYTIVSYDLVDPDTGEIVDTLSKSDFDSKFAICENCGHVFPLEVMTRCASDDCWYCDECRDDLLAICEDCGDYFLIEEMHEVSSGPWRGRKLVCEDCSGDYGTYCENCGDWYEYDDLIFCSDSERYYCNHWRCSDGLYRCEDCGRVFEYDDSVYYNGADECYYCEDCDGHHSGHVGSYHSHDYDEFRHNPGENRSLVPFMGFELETYADDHHHESDVASYTDEKFDTYFAMERDCSIGAGIEFISQPCSISYHLGMMDKITDWTRYLVRHGYNSHNSAKCGFHIHLDKKYFGNGLDCATAKLLFLFERHWDNMIRFSRRTSEQVSHWCGKYEDYDATEISYDDYGNRTAQQVVPGKKFASILKKEYKERYRAVNLCPRNTIEIRMWRGSLNPETIEATLKFTARLMELCKKATAVELYHMTFEDLLGDDPVVRSYWERVKNRAI